ncbi:hypothetical protein KM043_007812 [Ampulex compressa]|nr:hypothetical protein KM043_007812 [Ampulex compressa]
MVKLKVRKSVAECERKRESEESVGEVLEAQLMERDVMWNKDSICQDPGSTRFKIFQPLYSLTIRSFERAASRIKRLKSSGRASSRCKKRGSPLRYGGDSAHSSSRIETSA